MKIRISVIDLSALERWPGQARASTAIHKALDPLWEIRQWSGRSMPPPAVHITPLGNSSGILLAASIGQQPADR